MADMKIKIQLCVVLIAMLVTGCNLVSPETSDADADLTQTQEYAERETALMEEAKQELRDEQTATAAVEKAVEEALTTAVGAAVAETLTAIAPEPSITAIPVMDLPTATPTDSPMLIPTETPTAFPTETFILQPTATGSMACYQVLDPWCITHQGCATIDVRNQTGMNSSWRIWSDSEPVDSVFNIPAGHCTLVARPGKYNFQITYCGSEVNDFSWVLNDNWWYKLSTCD